MPPSYPRPAAVLFAVAFSFAPPRLCLADAANIRAASGRDLFQRAITDETQARWSDALEKFEQVASVQETATVRYHMGLCREHIGKLAAALNDYDHAYGDLAGTPSDAKIAPVLEQHRGELQRRVPTLSTEVAPGVDVTRVAIDGDTLPPGMIGRPVPVDPGDHELVLEASGRVPYRAIVSVTEGQHLRQILDPEKLSPAPVAIQTQAGTLIPNPSTPPERHGTGHLGRTLVVTGEAAVAAVGVAMLIIGRVQVGAAEDRIASDRITVPPPSSCFGHSVPPAACGDLAQAQNDRVSAGHMATTGAVLAAIGGVAFAGTWLLWSTEGAQTHIIERTALGFDGHRVVLSRSF